MAKIVEGFRVFGPTHVGPKITGSYCWFFTTLEFANTFAKQLCEDTGEEVVVAKTVGIWSPPKPPSAIWTAASGEAVPNDKP